jgi:hypothetical protein
MNRKGVCYDVGSVMGFNLRPSFRPEQVRRELQIIKDDLNRNAVRISGQDLGRLVMASEDALERGLEVWFCPTWDSRESLIEGDLLLSPPSTPLCSSQSCAHNQNPFDRSLTTLPKGHL